MMRREPEKTNTEASTETTMHASSEVVAKKPRKKMDSSEESDTQSGDVKKFGP